MAKTRPKRTLEQMEKVLGYKIDYGSSLDGGSPRFYSDLRLVPDHVYGRTLREFDEQLEPDSVAERIDISMEAPMQLAVKQTVKSGRSVLSARRIGRFGHFTFAVDVTYDFGLSLPFLLTAEETTKALSMSEHTYDFIQSTGPMFSRLPREIRDKIYFFAIPHGTWERRDQSTCLPNFAQSLGDYSGFYFSFGSLGLLASCKQMRFESLALLYRRTAFRLDDIDEVVQLLIAAGDIGRRNIESLEFAWSSKSDLEYQRTKVPEGEEYLTTMPVLHVDTCVQLLQQCYCLKRLCLLFDSDLVEELSPAAFGLNTGLQQLRSIRGLQQLEILDLGLDLLGQSTFVTWLQKDMLSPSPNGKEVLASSKDVSTI